MAGWGGRGRSGGWGGGGGAGQAAAVTALSRRRHAQARERDNAHLSEHVGDEIAAALTLTGQAAAGLHGDALALARLPGVHAALAAGQVDWPKACVFGRELRDIPAAAAAGMAGRVLPDAASLTTAQIRGRLRRLVLAFDPGAAARRKTTAAAGTDVVVWTENSGNAALAGRELPEADVLAADRRLTALARWLAARGAEGSLGQLRSAAFLTVVRGAALPTLLPAPAGTGNPAPPPPGTRGGSPGTGTAGTGNPGTGNPGTGNPGPGNPGSGTPGDPPA